MLRRGLAAAAVVLLVTAQASSGNQAAPQEDRAVLSLPPGRVAALFVVLPGCPACEQAIGWLNQARQAYSDLNFLLICPWLTDELQTAAEEADLPLGVDDGGRMGAGLGVTRAPTAVFFLDGVPLSRLDWPFTEQELLESLAELAAAPREGPWPYLGEEVPLGSFTSLDARTVDLDEQPGPFLVSFFNPLCPPCWDALPALVELGEEVPVVLVVSVPEALSEDERESLREAGLVTVRDEHGGLAQTLAVRVSPTHVIVDQEGVIRWVHEGTGELEELRSAVLAALSEDEKAERERNEGGM